MTAEPAMSTLERLAATGKKRITFFWLFGAAIYVAFLLYVGADRVYDALVAADKRLIAAFAFLQFSALWFRILKWRVALGTRSAQPFILSKLGGNLTPARIGEFSPLLIKGHRSARMGAWIILDRLLEVSATLTFGLIAVLTLGAGARSTLLLWVAGLLVCVASVGALFTRRSMWADLAQRHREHRLISRMTNAMAQVSDEFVAFGREAPLLWFMTLVATATDIVVGILVLASLGHWLSFNMLALTQIIHTLTSALPITPNATGIPYAAAGAFLHEAANVPIEILLTMVTLGLLSSNAVFWSSAALAFVGSNAPHRFRDQGELFDHLAGGDVLYEYGPEALAKLNALVEEKGRTLDVGCGDGIIGQAFTGQPVFGVDISPRCAAHAGKRGLRVAVGDVLGGLPYCDGAFDTVACVDVLHHLGQAWDTIFPELDRVLKDSGTIMIVEPDARNPFVRWTQAPGSPLRVAPWPNEPAIDPAELIPHLESLGYTLACTSLHIEGEQQERSVFPLWQRVVKAPFVIALAWRYRSLPNKFAIIGRKPPGVPS